MMIALGFMVGLAAFAFLCTRVYLLVVRRELTVKGVFYSRAETPIYYWFLLVMITLGAFMTLVVAVCYGIALFLQMFGDVAG